MKRVAANIILLLGVLYTPWWVPIVIALLAAFVFKKYVELIIVGLLIDLLYGQGATSLFPFITTIGTAAGFIIISFLKTKLRIYE